MKKTITESQLRKIVKETVNNVLKESDNSRFADLIEDDARTIYRIAHNWYHATDKPDGIEPIIDKLYEIASELEYLLR